MSQPLVSQLATVSPKRYLMGIDFPAVSGMVTLRLALQGGGLK
jgi:hypothetical protein